MKVTKLKVKDDVGFCFGCGKAICGHKYKIDLGSSAATFEFCRGCTRTLLNKITRALEPERGSK